MPHFVKHYYMEIWKEIPNTKYSVSNHSNIKNNHSGRILKCGIRKDGYRKCQLYINKKLVFINPYRVAMQVFNPIENDELYHIDHIDRNKTNDHISNLRWTTPKENMNNRSDRIINVSFAIYAQLLNKYGDENLYKELLKLL